MVGPVRGPNLPFGTPAVVATRWLVSHVCVPDHAGNRLRRWQTAGPRRRWPVSHGSQLQSLWILSTAAVS